MNKPELKSRAKLFEVIKLTMNVGCSGEQMGNINDSRHEWRAKGRLTLKHLKGEKLRETQVVFQRS